MKNNVKPGDMAWIVGARTEGGQQNIGRMVEVIEPAIDGSHHGRHFALAEAGGPSWFVRAQGLVKTQSPGGELRIVAVAAVYDKHLRPVKNPGQDERDESKAYLPPVPPRKRVQA